MKSGDPGWESVMVDTSAEFDKCTDFEKVINSQKLAKSEKFDF